MVKTHRAEKIAYGARGSAGAMLELNCPIFAPSRDSWPKRIEAWQATCANWS